MDAVCGVGLGHLGGLRGLFLARHGLLGPLRAGSGAAVAASLAAGLAVSSGLLFYHYRRQESYPTFEEIVFAFVLFVSSINFLWMAPLLFFL